MSDSGNFFAAGEPTGPLGKDHQLPNFPEADIGLWNQLRGYFKADISRKRAAWQKLDNEAKEMKQPPTRKQEVVNGPSAPTIGLQERQLSSRWVSKNRFL